jgi:hypothetical protein
MFKNIIVFASLATATANAKDSRPNILFVFSDDHAVKAISAYGGPLANVAPTPNIDRIAKEGTVFINSFCANSICGPSRANILTGKHSHKSKDIALLHLVRPVKAKEQMPVLLLRETLSGPVKYKKVAGNLTWRNIPAIGKKDNLVVRKKTDRKGKAGTSGSPWVLHSSKVGDVLIGITHGGGRAPQVAFVSRWIQETIQKHDPDRLVWATRKQALAK